MLENARLDGNFHLWPFWWQSGVPICPESTLVRNVVSEVIVIGAGYTGLQTALTLALSGKKVVVVDSVVPGWGASTRNAGQVIGATAGDLSLLMNHVNRKSAIAVLEERIQARDWFFNFITGNALSCSLQRTGRIHAFDSERSRRASGLEYREEKRILGDFQSLNRSEIHRELCSTIYHGGVLYPNDFAIDPNLYHQALLSLCNIAGVEVVAPCQVMSFRKSVRGFNVMTEMGMLYSESIVMATNAMMHELLPWVSNRIYHLENHMIATEPLPSGMVQWLIPKGRMVTDSHTPGCYYRPSPDGFRLVFGRSVGKPSRKNPYDGGKAFEHLQKSMVRIFPELSSTKIGYAWSGFESYSYDNRSYIGKHKGVYYALGYCGRGIALSNYLGMKLAQKMLDQENSYTVSDHVFFEKQPSISNKLKRSPLGLVLGWITSLLKGGGFTRNRDDTLL